MGHSRHFRPWLPGVALPLFPNNDHLFAEQRDDANGMDRPCSCPEQPTKSAWGL